MSTESSVLRADYNPKFYTRFLLLGIGAFAVMGWFLYDGLYGWPLANERYEAYTSMVEEGKGSQWEEYALSRGWDTDAPEEKDKHEQADIYGQFGWAGGCAVIGVLLLLRVFLARGQWMESDGQTLTTSWGKSFPMSAVTKIDKRKWANKGLAYLTYEVDGTSGKFTVDDFKFHRENTDAILYQIEQAAGVDKIVGGEPEPDPNAPKDDGKPAVDAENAEGNEDE